MKWCLSFLLLALSLHGFALSPSRQYSVLPSDFGLDYKEVSIPTSDGLKLNSWIFKATTGDSKKYVVISDDGN